MDTRIWIDILRRAGADIDSAMERFLDDEELYCSCITAYLKDENFEALSDALQAQEYDKAFIAAHTLKGVAANLGLTQLCAVISAIVEPLRTKEFENVDLLQLEREVQKQRAALCALLDDSR